MSADYVIDIASQMAGADKTTAELDALTRDLVGGGKSAEIFERALKMATSSLGDAKAATEAANMALATGQQEFSQLERAATRTAKALERAALKGDVSDTTAENARAAKEALDAYIPKLKQLEEASAKATTAQDAAGQKLANVQRLSRVASGSIASQNKSLKAYKDALGSTGGPLGKLSAGLLDKRQKFNELSGEVGKSRATMIFAASGAAHLAVGLLALGAAGTIAGIGLLALAIKLGNTSREASITREAMAAIHPEFAAVTGQLSALTNETGVAESELMGLTRSLKSARVAAGDMPKALRAAAQAEAALGKGGAQEFISQLQAGSLTVDQFASTVESKLGGSVSKRMLGLDSQAGRLKRGLAGIFGGLNIDPVLHGFGRLVDMFTETHAIGRAIKMLFEGVFGPIISGAE